MNIITEVPGQEEQQVSHAKWIRPNCYFCGQFMYGTSHKAVEHARTGQVYIRTMYVCPHCQYWQTIKVPRALAATITENVNELQVEEHEGQKPGVSNVLDKDAQEPLNGYAQMRFTCHFCPKTLYIVNRHLHENTRIGQTYVTSVYTCPRCDYWLTAKVPRKLAETVQRYEK